MSTKALCPHCRRLAPASYVLTDEGVELRRVCEDHGQTRNVVSKNPALFAEALALTRARAPGRRGLIVEMLDGCNMTCPTCIAASSPELSALRRPQVIALQIAQLRGLHQPLAILLSGGEPTIHPQFDQFLELVEHSDVPRRVLITNGVRLAEDPGLVRRLASGGGWEVFLQFDSFRADVLRDMRGDGDLVDLRAKALDALLSAGISTTLVCVIKRGQNLDEVEELVSFAVVTPGISGLQLQPVRDAGRLENYNPDQHSCDTSDVVAELGKMEFAPELSPHPASPLTIVGSHYDRSARRWARLPEQDGFFIEPASIGSSRLRLSILEYSDLANWSSLKSAYAALNVLQHNGTTASVDDHFVSDGLPALHARRLPHSSYGPRPLGRGRQDQEPFAGVTVQA